MTLLELKEKILANVESFDKFLRDNFDFENVRILHDDKIDYEKNIKHCEEEKPFRGFLSVTLHDCAEIVDVLFLHTDPGDKEESTVYLNMTSNVTRKFEWEGITLYIDHHYDEMD